MTNSNTKKQSEAMDKIRKIAEEAKMLVFMLVDEDLEIFDDDEDITQLEKHDIWERMDEALLDCYSEKLEMIVEEVKSDRYL